MRTIDLAHFEQLKCTGELPSPKGAALAILRSTQDEDIGIAELARVVRADPAFVGRLIKAANSVHAGSRRPIVSIPDALIVLGIPVVRQLALGFSLISEHGSGACRSFDYARFWSRSLACAVALQQLGAATRVAPAEELFSIGLLARIGELALATLFPVQYAELIERRRADPGASLALLEEHAFAMHHGELSAAMLADWGLPGFYVEAVAAQVRPQTSGFADNSRQASLLDALLLAQEIAELCLADEASRHALGRRLVDRGARLGLTSDTLSDICDKVGKEWLEWGALLNIDAQPLPSFQVTAGPSASAPAEESDGSVVEQMRILILAGKDMQAALSGMLGEHQLVVAEDARQGFELALARNPQIMIMDWRLPGMDGCELIGALRRTRSGRGIYIMILLPAQEEEKLVQAFQAGIDSCLTPALRPRILEARLLAAARVVRLRQEIERDREEIRRFAAELALSNRRLEEVALTDILTGLPNRRYLIERLRQEWALAQRTGRPLSCMVIDIDQFKGINDSLGHDAGDAVLREVAAALKSGLRAQDTLCRVGGDEFIALCPDAALSPAQGIAERMRQAVADMPGDLGQGGLAGGISISIGVATRAPEMGDPDALIKRADQGVLAAKQRGRDRVIALQSPGG